MLVLDQQVLVIVQPRKHPFSETSCVGIHVTLFWSIKVFRAMPGLRLIRRCVTSLRTGVITGESLYQVLGIQSSATAPEVKQAYRQLAKQCHPDLFLPGLEKVKDVLGRIIVQLSGLAAVIF